MTNKLAVKEEYKQMFAKRKEAKAALENPQSVNDELEASKARDEGLFYDKVMGLMNNLVERVKNTEDRLQLMERDKVDKSISSIIQDSRKKKGKNFFKMPEIPNTKPSPPSSPIKLASKRYIKRPLPPVTVDELLDAVLSLQSEISDVKKNQTELEAELRMIKKLVY